MQVDPNRAFVNPFPDYDASVPLETYIDANGKATQEWSRRLHKSIAELVSEIDSAPHRALSKSDSTVYTGAAGFALTFLHLSQRCELDPHREQYFLRAVEILCQIPGPRRDITFFCGDAGLFALEAVLCEREGQHQKSLSAVKKLMALYSEHEHNRQLPFEMLYGWSGYLYALLFVRHHLGRHAVDTSILNKVCELIIEGGKRGTHPDIASPLMYNWHNRFYVGAAHGFSGILYLLLELSHLPAVQAVLHSHIKPAVDFTLSIQFPSGNFPSSLENGSDRLVHWCHGAPGVIFTMITAYKVFQEEKYLQAALRCSDVIWTRGLLKKGFGLCHGPAGNAYGFLALFQLTKDARHLHRAFKFAEWCMDHRKRDEIAIPDRPFSLMEGIAGTAYFLADLLNPQTAGFPGFSYPPHAF